MVDVQTMGLIVQAIGVVGTLSAAMIAVRSYVNSNRRAQESRDRELETRQAQLFMQIFTLNCSQETADNWYKIFSADITDAQTFLRKTGMLGDLTDFDHELARALAYVWTHYDGMGLLAQKGLIDVELLTEMFSTEVIMMWEKLKPVTLEFRKKYPHAAENYEYLYNKMIEKNK